MPRFRCKDIGMECSYEDRVETREALMGKIAAHAKSAHNLGPIPDDVLTKVKAAIH